MRVLPTQRQILKESNNEFVGVNKTHGRVTVEPAWQLNMTGQTYGTDDKGPFRWWQDAAQSQVEVEVPNIESISINRSIDQDAATCSIVMSNQKHDDNDATPGNPDQLGNPGYYGFGYGSSEYSAHWGHVENTWKDVLIPNALLRTYQGYGGYTESGGKLVADSIGAAVASGNLAISGVWLIDTVSFGTSGKIRFECRDMGKLLIDQIIYAPLVPDRYANPGPKWCRYDYVDVPNTPIADDAPPQEPGPVQLVYEDSTVARWLGAGSTLGALAPNAFTSNEAKGSMGHGWRYWNNDYAKDWWQATSSGELNEVYVSPNGAPIGGAFFVFISVMENGVWQGDVNIPFSGDTNIALYHPEKPDLDTGVKYVKAAAIAPSASVNLDQKDGTWISLDRTYNAERVRVTISSTWLSPWGPNFYRSAVGNISARLTNVDPVSEQPAVTTTVTTVQSDGNLMDWIDPVRELLMWSGFTLYEGKEPGTPGVFGFLESAGTWPLECLDEDLFDKKAVMDAITSIKEVLGFIFFIDETGAVHFHSPNWWSPGNTTSAGVRLNFAHEVSDDETIIDYTASYTDNSVKSELVIVSDIPEGDLGASTRTVRFTPSTITPNDHDLTRGMTNPAIWSLDVAVETDEMKLMAALVSLHIMFNSRQGSVTIVANPEIQINDQIRITERISSEGYLHYVRSVSSEMNLITGEWTMTLGTNWLGDQDLWAFNRDKLLSYFSDKNDAARIPSKEGDGYVVI